MKPLAPLLSSYLRVHLPKERNASPHTIATYAHSFTLLLRFASSKLSRRPTDLNVEDIDPKLILEFLDHIEQDRSNCAKTRNVRLATIRALFQYIEYNEPACLEQCLRIRSIPRKRSDEKLIPHLTRKEIEGIISAPDVSTLTGVRDRAMIHLCYCAGLRAAELLSLRITDFPDRSLVTVHIIGKGRRERVLPLWKAARQDISTWLARRPAGNSPELFLNKYGNRLSRDGLALRLQKYTKSAATKVPSLATKTVTPHVLRHSCAVHILEATGDIRKVALWLGHSSTQTTEIYLRVDAVEKLAMMKSLVPPTLKPGKFKSPTDNILSVLNEAQKM